MGYGEIRKAIRELEDQQRADYVGFNKCVEGLTGAAHIEADLRKDAFAALAARLDYLADAQKNHLDLQAQVIWTQGQVKKLENREQKLRQRDAQISARIDEMWDTLMPPGCRADIEAAQAAHDKEELDRLVDYIRSELPDGTAGMGETVTDTAIRLLKTYWAALGEIAQELKSVTAYSGPVTNAYRVAHAALDVSLEQGDDVV